MVFWEQHGLQCRFCTPGMIMAASDLLARNPDPSEAEIRHAIEGNYCRCTGYQNIVAAIRQAGQIMRGEEVAIPIEGAGEAVPWPIRARAARRAEEGRSNGHRTRLRRTDQAQGGSALRHRHRQLRRRRPAAGHDVRVGPALANVRARIISVDTSPAKEMPGVLAVWSGKDLEADVNPLPMAWAAGGKFGGEVGGIVNNVNSPRVLATDDVKWTGEGVALVIAETREQEEDAAQAIEVSLGSAAQRSRHRGRDRRRRAAAPRERTEERGVHLGRRRCDGTDAALADADVVVKQRLVNHASHPEPDGAARLDRPVESPAPTSHDLDGVADAAHQRLLLAAFVLGVPENKIRVIAPDVGGAFGQKIFSATPT